MIKQSVFEDDLIRGMQDGLKKQTIPNLSQAAECLHAALEIFEQQGLSKRADQVLVLLEKLAKKPQKIDRHTKGLTPEKEVANLKNHGTPFNMVDDIPPMKKELTKDDMDADFMGLLDAPSFDFNASDDELMGKEVIEDDLLVFDQEKPLSDFEDEKD